MLLEGGASLLDRGGPVLPWIGMLSLLMWSMAAERYCYLRWRMPLELLALVAHWSHERPRSRAVARRLHAQRIAHVEARARRHLPLLRALVQALPLLGLLGTVLGLTHTFDGIADAGLGNRRVIAAGIAESLIATAAGLASAAAGLYACARLDVRADAARLAAARALGDGA